MRPMSEMGIVVIDVTTRCPHQCSGCTRMIGHVPVRDIDLQVFKDAVDSLVDHPGMIGVIGGEPLLWPHFEEATEYLVAKTGGPDVRGPVNPPIRNIVHFLLSYYGNVKVKRGLFTSLPPNTISHWEQILDSYQYVGFNTHENAGLHQQILVASNELPMAEEERRRKISDCWINKFWSCSITPQGCWPCEVMGTLAHAFDGPGPKQGWPIEKGWWKRPVSDWGDMLKWCDLCGAAMDVPRLLATDKSEIVSPANYERLRKMGSRKIASGDVKIMDVASYDPAAYKAEKHVNWYLPSTKDNQPDLTTRISSANNLKPRKLEGVVFCAGRSDLLRITLPWNLKHLDSVVVISSVEDATCSAVAKEHGAPFIVASESMLSTALASTSPHDWSLFIDDDILLPPQFKAAFQGVILNPGTLYTSTRTHSSPEKSVEWFDGYNQDAMFSGKTDDGQQYRGYFQLFHANAKSLSGEKKVDCITQRWGVDKRCLLDLKVVQLIPSVQRD